MRKIFCLWLTIIMTVQEGKQINRVFVVLLHKFGRNLFNTEFSLFKRYSSSVIYLYTLKTDLTKSEPVSYSQ